MEDQQIEDLQEDGAGASPRTPDAAGEPSEADALKKECADNLAGWQRALADYANLKRETERTQSDFARFASAGVITALLPVIDSFKKAHEAFPVPSDGGTPDTAALMQWADGVGHVKSQFDGVLARAGVKAIDESGVPFDPTLHEAMMMQPATPETPSGTVVKVLEPGYKMHDRVLRAAKVVVSE